MNIKEFKDRLQKLSAQEIKELQVEEAQRIIMENVNLIADVEGVLFDEIGEFGKHKIAVDQLKSLKTTITEQNRALKSVIENG